MTSLNAKFLFDEYSKLFIDEYYKSKNDPFFWGTFLLAPIFILIVFSVIYDCLSNSNNKIEPTQEDDDDEDDENNENKENKETEENDYEEDSEDDATSIDSEYSKTSDEEEDSVDEKYSSVLFKSFSLLTKKQLLKLIGSKYKNKNKDELVIIAMYKLISKAVESSRSMPKGVKIYIFELYQIESNDS